MIRAPSFGIDQDHEDGLSARILRTYKRENMIERNKREKVGEEREINKMELVDQAILSNT